MCDPTMFLAGTQLVVGAGSALAGYGSQVDQASAQNRAYEANAQAANRSAVNQFTQMQLRMQQDEMAAGQQKAEAARDARAARATATTAAGESGVSGISVQALLGEYYGRQGSYNAGVDQQTNWSQTQSMQEMQGIQSETQSRINSVQRVKKPSFWDAGLRILGAGINAGTSIYQSQQKAGA